MSEPTVTHAPVEGVRAGRLDVAQIDAFTDRPFRGNPAAVCVLPEDWPAGPAMQAIALEMNLSETAFLRRRGDGDWDLRWFTPGAEVDLCGHATLASAHHLWESRQVAEGDELRFHTRSGWLTARRPEEAAKAAAGWIELDFPAQPPHQETPPDGLLGALGVDADWVGSNGTDWLVEVGSEAAVRSATPDLGALRRVPARGVIVTARAASADAGYDFVSRFFAPAVAVDEDPVTGSAHCCLAPFWCGKLGRPALVGYQASARGGFVGVRLDGDRVRLAGQAVTVLRGSLLHLP